MPYNVKKTFFGDETMNYDSFYGYENEKAYDMSVPAMAPQPAAAQADSVFLYPQNLSNAIALIEQAVMGETEDRMFYTYLIENAPSAEDKKIISGIRDDEMKHYGMFRKLYYEITHRQIPAQKEEAFVPPASYCEGLGKSVIGETNAVRKYRQILYAMQARVHINMLTEIITDEIRHGILYNYLYAKNGCKA